MGKGMVSQPIWIGIVIGVFFVGIGMSYAIFANTYDPMSMKFHDQELFDQMMSQNPKMTQQWMDSSMMQDPQFGQQMIGSMMMGSNPIEQHENMLEMMEVMTENEDLMNHMYAHMLENEKMVHQMLTMMSQSPHMKDHMAAHVSGDLSEYAYLDEEKHEEHGHEDEH